MNNFPSLESNPKFNGQLVSEIRVLFKTRYFFPLVMRKQLENLDYLSYIGGLLGLLAGISMLSFIEVIYYSSIQILLNFVINRKDLQVHPIPADQKSLSRFDKILKEISRKLSCLKGLMIHSVNFISDTRKSFFERYQRVIV